jgi:hypothetical protein
MNVGGEVLEGPVNYRNCQACLVGEVLKQMAGLIMGLVECCWLSQNNLLQIHFQSRREGWQLQRRPSSAEYLQVLSRKVAVGARQAGAELTVLGHRSNQLQHQNLLLG